MGRNVMNSHDDGNGGPVLGFVLAMLALFVMLMA
jgi:hypothetical protein